MHARRRLTSLNQPELLSLNRFQKLSSQSLKRRFLPSTYSRMPTGDQSDTRKCGVGEVLNCPNQTGARSLTLFNHIKAGNPEKVVPAPSVRITPTRFDAENQELACYSKCSIPLSTSFSWQLLDGGKFESNRELSYNTLDFSILQTDGLAPSPVLG